MSAFTRLGASLWDWEPWTDLRAQTRILWLALYTSAEAKRHVPGLWQGGIPTMADAARMPPDDVIAALDQLLERELVEYDQKLRVLRLCGLPDAGEYPSNGKVILGWWTKFNTVPPCPVRDAHVRTIAWIIDNGSRRAGTATDNHKEAWSQTFGTITIPPPRRRGIRRLADSLWDTGTQVQPSLFQSHADPMPTGNGIPMVGEGSYPQSPQPSVDNSAVLRQMNKNRGPETVSDTVSDTDRIPDPGSRIPEDLSFSGELVVRPALTLVPPYSASQVIRAMAQGPWDPAFDRTHHDAIGGLVPIWAAAGVVLDDFVVLARYNDVSALKMSARVLVGCDLPSVIAHAHKSLRERDARLSMLKEFQGG